MPECNQERSIYRILHESLQWRTVSADRNLGEDRKTDPDSSEHLQPIRPFLHLPSAPHLLDKANAYLVFKTSSAV